MNSRTRIKKKDKTQVLGAHNSIRIFDKIADQLKKSVALVGYALRHSSVPPQGGYLELRANY